MNRTRLAILAAAGLSAAAIATPAAAQDDGDDGVLEETGEAIGTVVEQTGEAVGSAVEETGEALGLQDDTDGATDQTDAGERRRPAEDGAAMADGEGEGDMTAEGMADRTGEADTAGEGMTDEAAEGDAGGDAMADDGDPDG